MIIDRRAIMKAAWTIARRFAGNRETWRRRISRALKSVWGNVKTAQRVALSVAARPAVNVASTDSPAILRAEIIALENADRLGWAGMERLSALKSQYARLTETAAKLAA